MEDGSTVDNPEFIQEFLDKCNKDIWDAIKSKLDSIRRENNYTDVTVACTNTECNKEFVTPFVFEQTNFFA
jgi:hypothetical protein